MCKYRVFKLTVMILALVALFTVGCSEDSSPTEPTNDMALVGKWKMVTLSSDTEIITESQLDSMGVVYFLKFEANNTFENITNFSQPLDTVYGTWETTDSKLILTKGEQSFTWSYSVNDTILNLALSDEVDMELKKQ